MFPFWSQKLTSYPVLLICVRPFSPSTLIPPRGCSQNLLAGFVKKFRPSSWVLIFRCSSKVHSALPKPLQQGTFDHVQECTQTSSMAVHTIGTEYSVYWPMRVSNRRILHKTACTLEKTQDTKLHYQIILSLIINTFTFINSFLLYSVGPKAVRLLVVINDWPLYTETI